MTLIDELVIDSLRSIRPRDGFAAELFVLLSNDAALPRLAAAHPAARGRWLRVGTVAGVLSATGVAYWGVRRHRHKGVA